MSAARPPKPAKPAKPAAPKRSSQKIPAPIWVLVGASFLVAAGFGLIAPILPQFAKSFEVSNFESALVISVFAFTRVIFAPFVSYVTRAIGETRAYMVGLLGVAVSSGLIGFAQDYWQLVIFRALGGIGSVTFTVAAMTILVRASPPRIRGRVSSLYASSFLIGNIMGPLIGGVLAPFGMRVPFWIYGVLLTLASIFVGVFMNRALARHASSGHARPVATDPLTMREALGDVTFRAALITSFANGWASLGVRTALVPLLIVASLGLGDAQASTVAGLALSVYAGGNALMVFVSGFASDRYGRKPLVLAGLTLLAASTIAIGFASSTALVLGLSVLAGIGSGLMNPAQQAAVADIIGNKRDGSKVLAVNSMIVDIGTIGGPLIAGAIADVWGFPWAFGVSGALVVIALIAWAVAKETLGREPIEDTRAIQVVQTGAIPVVRPGAASSVEADASGPRATDV